MNAARRTAAVASLLLLLAAQATQAQTIWQNGTNDSNWQNGGNWSAGTPAAGSTAQFDDTGANSATPLTLGAATTGTLNFINNSNNYTLGAAGGTDTLAFSGGGNSLTQSGTGNNTINAQISASGLTGTVSAGTLNLTNGGNAIASGSTFGVTSGGTLSATGAALGSAGVNLTNGTLVLSGGLGPVPGISGNYWPLSPGDTPANLGNASVTNNWNTTSAATLQATVNNFGPAIVHQVLADNSTPPSLPNGPTYGAPNNPFGAGVGLAPTGYVGGIDFPNNGTNNFAATGVNISGTGTTGPNYTGPGSGYNGISAEWSGTVNLSQPGTLNFNVDSDDFAAVIVNGNIILSRGNGGTGFNGNSNGGGPNDTNGSVTLPAGSDSIQVIWDQGNGGWGIVGLYSFTPSAGPNMGVAEAANYIGNDNAAGDVTFTTTGIVGVSTAGNPISSTGNSTLTVNSSQSSTVGTVTLNNGTDLTVNGSAPMVSFSGTVLNGTSMTISNSVPVSTGAVSGSGGWGPGSSLTGAGSGNLYLDNTGNTAFTAGTTINATGSGQVVGVNVGGTNTLGVATLNLNGGNFSLGTDGVNNAFGNAITVNGSGGTITAQALGAGATANQTVNLTGGISLGGSTLNLNTANGYTLAIGSQITGGGTVNGIGNVAINAASPSFSGNYNVNGGTTSENVVGGFGTSFVSVNNGASLNMTAAGDTPGRGANVNSGNLNLNAGGINLANTNVNGGGTLNLNVDQGATGGIVPNAAIQGTVGVNTFQSPGYNLTMAAGSTIQSNGTQTFASNLSLQGGVNTGGNNSNLSLTGNLTGAGGLNQNGTGTLTLNGPAGSASYSGATNVSFGTLALQTNLTGGGNAIVNPGATLNIGANGSLGTSALTSNGLTTLTAPGASLGSGPVSVGIGGQLLFNTSGTNYSGSSITMTGATLHVASGSANLGNAVITGDVAGFAAGLTEGRILGNGFDTSTANPGNGGLQPGPLLSVSNNVFDNLAVSAHTWSDNTTWVYTGQINITAAEAANGITLGKSIDDNTSLTIDGHNVINNQTWNQPQGVFIPGTNQDSGTYLHAGLNTFELRIGNGGGGAGYVGDPNDQNAQFGGAVHPPANVPSSLWAAGTTLGLGFGFADGNPFSLPNYTATNLSNGNYGGQLNAMFDNGTGNLFQVATPGSTISVDSGTSLTAGSIASAQQLNLNGSLTLSSTTANTVGNVVNATVAGPATLNLGANNSFSANSTTITDGNSLTLGGPGRFNVLASQTMAIGSTNSATALNVNGGVFHVDGTVSGPGMVNVNAGGTIGGGGNVGVAVHIGSGGILAPGDAANLTVASLSLADNSTMTYNLNTANVEHLAYSPANGNDLTTVTNSNGLAVSSNAYLFGTDGTTVNVIPGANFGRGTYELLAYTGTFTGSLSSFGIGTAPSQFDYQFVNLLTPGGGQIDLRVTPEPSAVVLLALGLAGLAIGCRRRLAKRAA